MVAASRIPEERRHSCASEMVQDHPMWSMSALFGVGVGIGFVIGHLLAENAGRQLQHRDTLLEKLSGRIGETLKNTLPEGLWLHSS